MQTIVKDRIHSNLPTHSMLAQRMLDRIGSRLKTHFCENKKLIEYFESANYDRCIHTLNEIVADFKAHRRFSPKTRKEHHQLLQDLSVWNKKFAQYLNPAAEHK